MFYKFCFCNVLLKKRQELRSRIENLELKFTFLISLLIHEQYSYLFPSRNHVVLFNMYIKIMKLPASRSYLNTDNKVMNYQSVILLYLTCTLKLWNYQLLSCSS